MLHLNTQLPPNHKKNTIFMLFAYLNFTDQVIHMKIGKVLHFLDKDGHFPKRLTLMINKSNGI